MKHIDILLAIAELENKVVEVQHGCCASSGEDVTYLELINDSFLGHGYSEAYLPDCNALNCHLRDKYKVSVDYDAGVAYTNLTSKGVVARVLFTGNPCNAVLKVILKANKLWVGE